MSSVTYPTLSGTINSSELNTNFSDVVSLASSIGNEQLSGGITSDKISDRYTVSYDTVCVIPIVKSTDVIGTAATEFLLTAGGASTTDIIQWQPIMRAGMEAYLCSINVYVRSNTDSPQIRFYLNGSSATGSLVGGSAVTLAADNTIYTLGQTDPISNPLLAMSNGDYVTINLYGNSGANPGMLGVFVTFCTKYVLQA